MDFSYWLNINDNLLMLADQREEYDLFLSLAARFHYQVGVVSDEFPLLSRLSALDNITLMGMYHRGLSRAAAKREIAIHTTALEVDDILNGFRKDLTPEQRLKMYVLRCLAKGNTIMLLETPSVSQVELAMQCMEKTGKKLRLWIIALHGDAEAYARFAFKHIAIGG